jgi:hypothetical protein
MTDLAGGTVNPGSPSTVTTEPVTSPVRHAYPLAVRDASLATALSLMMRSLPYAMARFGVLLAASIAVILWLAVMIGGAGWLGAHIASIFGWVWFILFLVGGGFVWGTVLRYVLHLISCGHVAVLTELITKGQVGNGSEPMFAYGKRIVIARFGEANVLLGLNLLVRGIVESFHRTLDWVSEMIPIPGLDGIASVINIILKAATRYLDKVIFSYNLARGDEDPWRSSRDGLIYYAQNAKPVLKTALWSIVVERILTFVLWLALLIPAGLITASLPGSLRNLGGVMTILVAVLLAGPLRAAFVKPLFLIVMLVRFHATIEGQAINPQWDERLSALSDKFRNLSLASAVARGRSRWAKVWS